MTENPYEEFKKNQPQYYDGWNEGYNQAIEDVLNSYEWPTDLGYFYELIGTLKKVSE